MQTRADHKDLYLILEIDRAASNEEIKKAYRHQALIWHPDKVEPSKRDEAEAMFKDIKQAYDVLSDAEKRQLYDQYGAPSLEPDFEPPPPIPAYPPQTAFQPQPTFQQPMPTPFPNFPEFPPFLRRRSSFESGLYPNRPGPEVYGTYPVLQPQFYVYPQGVPAPGIPFAPPPVQTFFVAPPLFQVNPTLGPVPLVQPNFQPPQPFAFIINPPTSVPLQFASPFQAQPAEPFPPTADEYSPLAEPQWNPPPNSTASPVGGAEARAGAGAGGGGAGGAGGNRLPPKRGSKLGEGIREYLRRRKSSVDIRSNPPAAAWGEPPGGRKPSPSRNQPTGKYKFRFFN